MSQPGFVGHDKAGRFLHYCHCGEWGAYGYDVALNRDQLGTWYCLEHRPPPPVPAPRQEAPPLPPLAPTQGSLF